MKRYNRIDIDFSVSDEREGEALTELRKPFNGISLRNDGIILKNYAGVQQTYFQSRCKNDLFKL